VDGQYLNYDNNPLRTTDFTGLCAAMVKLQAPNKKVGKHTSVSGRSTSGAVLYSNKCACLIRKSVQCGQIVVLPPSKKIGINLDYEFYRANLYDLNFEIVTQNTCCRAKLAYVNITGIKFPSRPSEQACALNKG